MKNLRIGNKNIGKNQPTFIIGEAGVNHNGDIKNAKKMVDIAKQCGADAIKFQTYKTENLLSSKTQFANYQKKNTSYKTAAEMLKQLELSFTDFMELIEYCNEKDLIFLSTPFDLESLEFLDQSGISAFKVSSGDLNNFPFLLEMIKKKKPILISTGMSTMKEVSDTMSFFSTNNFSKLVLFQCTTSYPAPFNSLDLKVIRNYKQKFNNIIVGYSDHSLGTLVGALAVGLGASVIEKHFTMSKSMKGPDHKASLDPVQFNEYISNIRTAELALGSFEKQINLEEREIRKVARKSLVAKRTIHSGEIIQSKDIVIKRPGIGIPPSDFEKVIGKKTRNQIIADTLIDWNDIF